MRSLSAQTLIFQLMFSSCDVVSMEGMQSILIEVDSKIHTFTPPKINGWNLEMMVSNRNLLFQGSIFRFHVCFGGSIFYKLS